MATAFCMQRHHDAVKTIENLSLNPSLRIGGPCIQFGPSDANHATTHLLSD